MQVQRFDDPAALADEATPFLLQREAENCFFLGLIPTLKKPSETLLFLVRSPDGPAAVATMTPGRHMMITAAPDEATAALAEHLHQTGTPLPGIQGPRATVQSFAARWTRLTGQSPQPRTQMAVYQLTRVNPLDPPPPGAMRFAQPSDLELITSWIEAFRADVGEPHPTPARSLAAEYLADNGMVLWETQGSAVSLAGFKGFTPNGVRVILVYTPTAHRGRGYASALVATLSQHLLDSGRKFCFLYADLNAPTPNKIYRQIGYQHVSDSVQIFFC
jgi:predicted GNAT family acetyltransferase